MCKKVLIVDDDSLFVSKIIGRHVNMDFSFTIADSIERANDFMENTDFDYILANVKVPGGNSLSLRQPSAVTMYMSNIMADHELVKDSGSTCYMKSDLSAYETNIFN